MPPVPPPGGNDQLALRIGAAQDAIGDEAPPVQPDAADPAAEAKEKTCGEKTWAVLDYIGDEILEFLFDFFGAMQFDDGPQVIQCGKKRDKMQRIVRKAPANTQLKAKKPPAPPPGTSIVQDFVKAFDQDSDDDFDAEDLFEVVGQALPVFTSCQAGITALLWVVGHFVSGKELAGLETLAPGSTDLATNNDCNDLRWEIWRWWTYQFSHVGASHVGLNCLIIVLFGIALEGFHGPLRMCVMFQIGVFGGACCYWVIDVHTRVVGASGGCYAMMGIYAAHVIMNHDVISYKYMKAFTIFVMVVLGFLPVLTQQGEDGVSHSAHFGGILFGLIAGIYVGKNQRVTQHEWTLQYVTLGIGVVLIIFSLGWLLNWPPKGIFDDVGWCWDRQISDVKEFGDRDFHCVRCDSKECAKRWSAAQYVAGVVASACDKAGWKVTER
eukprot:TRINITY_DN1125_c0_g1_i2.p1 TRINITY_DN1125_c0_g1~~TRINITY_DN1125_c0_g1_i2.p1  ORF type:complete len:438 (-),score=88.60 TRINITY_DN1125_c0_g1_i2:124-1437(-)